MKQNQTRPYKQHNFTPFRVCALRLLICLAPLPLWRKKKVLQNTLLYFDYWGQDLRQKRANLQEMREPLNHS